MDLNFSVSTSKSVCEIILCMKFVLFFHFSIDLNFWIIMLFQKGLGITGRPLFEGMICVERYLAVVHPVTFLKYKHLR